jgi:Ring finger domain
MADDPLTCVICHEAMEPYHQVVKPKRCTHTFHAICINIWLARHRSCPLCRRRISLTTQMPWRTLFAVALVVSQEMALDRARYTYAFLSVLLRTYRTSQAWKTARDVLIASAEQFEVGTTRLPFLDLSTRTTAKKERQKWAELYTQVSGEPYRTSERVRSARRVVIEQLLPQVYAP